jgi:hypothetical protein
VRLPSSHFRERIAARKTMGSLAVFGSSTVRIWLYIRLCAKSRLLFRISEHTPVARHKRLYASVRRRDDGTERRRDAALARRSGLR